MGEAIRRLAASVAAVLLTLGGFGALSPAAVVPGCGMSAPVPPTMILEFETARQPPLPQWHEPA